MEGKRRLRDLYAPQVDFPLDLSASSQSPQQDLRTQMQKMLDLGGLRAQNQKMRQKLVNKDKKELFQARVTLLNETRKNLFEKYQSTSRRSRTLAKSTTTFDQFMKEISKANDQEKESSNKLRIEKTFHKLFPGLSNLFYEDGIE